MARAFSPPMPMRFCLTLESESILVTLWRNCCSVSPGFLSSRGASTFFASSFLGGLGFTFATLIFALGTFKFFFVLLDLGVLIFFLTANTITHNEPILGHF